MLIELNGLAWAMLSGVVAGYLVRTTAGVLNLARLSAPLPAILQDVYTGDTDQRARRYARARLRLGLAADAWQTLLLAAFWLTGGFGWLEAWSAHLPLGTDGRTVAFLCLLGLGSSLAMLPFQLISIFGVERHFGFNRMTVTGFVIDGLKSLFLAALLLVPAGFLMTAILRREGPGGWLVIWSLTLLLGLALSYLAPRWIMPWFHRFTPLPDGEPGDSLRAYAARLNFQIADLSVVDGSRRSTKANAFFTGFGKNRRIALFDTLLASHDTPELVAVLAHEVGHERRHHLWKMLGLGALESGGFFLLAATLSGSPEVMRALGLAAPSLHGTLLAAAILWKWPALFLGPATAWLSRRHEFEADAFAAQTTGTPAHLASALRKLGKNSLGNPVPHPFHVWLNYTHPPLAWRLQSLENHPPHVPNP